MSVVLVHGMWHTPAHFDLVATPLRGSGIDVVIPALHRGSLAADTAAVQAAVDATAEAGGTAPVVLGHSYGGSVITGLTGMAHLIYLAAFVPDHGESAASLGGPAPWADEAVLRRADGGSEVDPTRAIDAMYSDCPPGVAAWAAKALRPQAPGHGRGIPERVAWHQVPSTYVVCSGDRVVDPALQRQMGRRCARALERESGHSPFLSRPDLVADLIREVLADPGSARNTRARRRLCPPGLGSPVTRAAPSANDDREGAAGLGRQVVDVGVEARSVATDD